MPAFNFFQSLRRGPSSSRATKRVARRNRQYHQARRKRQALVQTLEDRRVLASFVVTAGGDTGTGTLREAVIAANAAPGPDDITFDSSVTGTILLSAANGELSITDPVTITGPGSDTLTIRAGASVANEFRVMSISTTAGDVSIEGVTLTGGRIVDEAGGAIQFDSSGTLTIRSSVISGNVANNGGGIYSRYDGTVDVASSTIAANTAQYGAGGGIQNVDGAISLSSSVLTGNRSYYSGGGIFSQYAGSVTITDSQITDNTVTEDGQHGAGVYSGEGAVTISGSTISGNTSPSDGGGVYNYNGDLTVTNTLVTGNQAGESGGGLFNYLGAFSITNTTVSGNSSLYGDGGGVSNAAGALTLTRSTISNNSAVTEGGGVSNSSGQIISRDSTIALNTAGADGGGFATLSGDIILINSTVSTNQANVRGGGIKSTSAFVRLVNSTITLNTANIEGGGVHLQDDDSGEGILVYNSIIAQNMAPIGGDFTAPFDPMDDLEVQFSLIGSNDGTSLTASATADANGNLIGTPTVNINAALGPLTGNGGSTQTHALSPASVAVDAGSNALALDLGADGAVGGGDDVALATDQRGGLFARVAAQGTSTVDIGAFESQSTPTLRVDTLEDADDGDLSEGDRSLRELIRIANENAGPETIFVDGSLMGSMMLDPFLGPITISDSLTLGGPSVLAPLTIEKAAGQDSRLFVITGASTDVNFDAIQFVGGAAGTADGGAILASGGDLVIRRSSFTGNSAASGGAIAVTSGTLAIAATTLSGNNATAGDGGAIHASGTASSVAVSSSTVSGNTASGSGGGVFTENTPVAITNSTVTLNESTTSGGGIGLLADGGGEGLDIDNSIIAGNTSGSAADFLAPLNSINLNVDASLIGDSDGTTLTADGTLIGGGAQPIVDPMLAALADNGGPTLTHSPVTGSPAIGAGNNAILPLDTYDINGNNVSSEILPVDQRGAVRVVDSMDIGAFEVAPPAEVMWDTPADIVFGTALSSTELSATTGSIGTLTFTPDVGTVLDAGDAQTLTVVFTPNNPLQVGATTATVDINVLKADPVITWADPAAIEFNTALTATELNATADVMGTFVYDPPIDTVLDSGSQTLSVTFTPDDSDNYNEVMATATIVVNGVDPVVTWNDPAGITFGTLLDNTQLNASSTTAGTFAYTPDIGAQLNAGDNQVLSVTFTPDSGNFNEVTATVMIDVAKADPVLTWNDPADIGAGASLSDTQLNATADVAGTFVYTPPVGTILNGGDNQTLMVAFTPTDTTNYNDASASVSINVVVGDDFGDAPSPYPTLLADDGARHTTGALTLGAGIDAEGNGQPTAAADGDGSDEDGVTVIASPVVSDVDTTASFLVNASAASRLDAWIDFNADGDWGDAGEQIATNLSLSSGDNTLSYTVPAGAAAGSTVARFRLSSTGGLAPTGAATDGEVEDYQITLLGGAAAPSVALPSGSATISIDATNFSVSDQSTNLFVAPASGLGAVSVQGGAADDSITLDFDGGPGGGLSLDGQGGANTLVVNGPAIDLTSGGLVSAANFSSIDMNDAAGSSVTINAATVAALSPVDNLITVRGGAGDEVVFSDAEDWRLGEPLINGSDFLQVAINSSTGEEVRFSLRSGWQNSIEASDVNNNGEVTAGDALIIINELGRRAFSDGTTQALDDPLATTPWPGTYYDQNGDLNVTALDALRVINRLAQITNGGELVESELVAGQSPIDQVTRALNALLTPEGEDLSATPKLCSIDHSSGSLDASSADAVLSGSDASEDDWAASVDELLSDMTP